MEALLARASEASLAYDEAKDFHRVTAEAEYRDEATDPLYKKGQACFLPPAPYPYLPPGDLSSSAPRDGARSRICCARRERRRSLEPTSVALQSKRIWGELYKVLDSSDVVVQATPAPPSLCR